MSIQPSPTNTTTPVYNPIFYVNPTASSGIDVAFLDANYLKFPTAQGSEEFTDGLFTTNTIDFNSSTGTDREITGLSKSNFTDILGNTSYTAYIEENSTAIGSYDGGLIINSSNSINLVGTTILANGSPIGTGTGNVSTTSNNTFVSPATTQTFQNQVVDMDNSQLTFSNNGYIRWDNGSSLLNFPITIPPSSVASGLGMSWNQLTGSNGEVDLVCYGQGGQGGFSFYSNQIGSTSATPIANMFPNGISFFTDIVSNNTFSGQNYFSNGYINLPNLTTTFPSTPVGYSQFISFNNAPWFSTTAGGGVQIATLTNLATYAPLNSPALTGTPTAQTPTVGDSSTNIATTAFVATSFAPKASPTLTGTPTAPTATAGTNTTQIATTAFVATSFAPLANPTFTGIPNAPTASFGTNTTQLATTAFVQNAISGGNFITASWIAQLNGVNTEWKGWIPSSVTALTFSFYFYTNTPANTENRGINEQITPDNSQLCGYGVAYRQNYMTAGAVQYGYVFTILSYIGLSIASPNLTIYSIGIYPPSPTDGCCYCYLKNANDGGYFYITPDNGLTLLISQASN